MTKVKVSIQLTNSNCPHCKGTGVIPISSPTDGRILSAACYGDEMGPIVDNEAQPSREAQAKTIQKGLLLPEEQEQALHLPNVSRAEGGPFCTCSQGKGLDEEDGVLYCIDCGLDVQVQNGG